MRSLNWMIIGLLVSLAGCSSSEVAETESSVDARYVATSEPTDAVAVGDLRASAENGQQVTLLGRVGGSSEPFVDGLAAFTVVDPKVAYCSDDEGCPTPWDYCCKRDEVKNNILTVKVVDESGNIVNRDARKLLGVKELSMVVVTGEAKVDDQGNLTVASGQVFVRPSE